MAGGARGIHIEGAAEGLAGGDDVQLAVQKEQWRGGRADHGQRQAERAVKIDGHGGGQDRPSRLPEAFETKAIPVFVCRGPNRASSIRHIAPFGSGPARIRREGRRLQSRGVFRNQRLTSRLRTAMFTAAQCLAKAEDLEQKAAGTLTPDARDAYRDMAEAWRGLAGRALVQDQRVILAGRTPAAS